MKQFIEVEIDVPEGYHAVSYRKLQYGDLWMNQAGGVEVWRASCPSFADHFVLKESVKLSDDEATERTRDILEAKYSGAQC